MALYLLDTDAAIDILKQVPSTVAIATQLDQEGDILCTCDIVLGEVFSGLSPEQIEQSAEIVDAFVFLASTANIGRQAGVWRYAFVRRGIQLSITDTIIAATAHAYGAGIITRNVSHFPMAEVLVHPLPPVQR